MAASARWPGSGAGEAPARDRPSPVVLGLKLALLAGFAATLSLGAEHPLPVGCLLLEALYAAASGFSVVLGVLRRERFEPGVYGHWHEALALGAAALLTHAALVSLG